MNGKVEYAAVFALVALLAIVPLSVAQAQPSAGPPLVATPPAAISPSVPLRMDTSLTADIRANLVETEMTRDEALTLVRGYFGVDYPMFGKIYPAEIRKELPGSAGYVPGIPRLGIPALTESDASLGVANGRHMRPGDQAVALPSSLLTAATWNGALAYAGGAMIGAEARRKGFDVLLAGGVDLAREPRGGRTFEYAGEDPLLAGTMVGEAIRGTQDQRIISTIKHFALNDQETGRGVMDATISDAAMRESDLLAFEIAVEHGDPGAVMCSYNRLNTVYACENDYLLNKVLKGDWGYRGFVLSDWGAVHSTVDAANNGLDQESSYTHDRADYFGQALAQAIDAGTVPETRLYDMVHRILRTMFAKGLFDHPIVKQPINAMADLAVAQRDAEEGIVLLKNAQGLLPLSFVKRPSHRITIIGGYADLGVLSGSGSSQVIPIGNTPSLEVMAGGAVRGEQIPTGTIILDPPSPYTAIRAQAPWARVVFYDGSDIAKAASLARVSDIVIIFAQQWTAEGWDVPDLSLPGDQDELIAAVADANPRTIVVVESGTAVTMPWLDKVGAVLEAWYPGNRGADAIARILFGAVNPSGRLPITFPQSESQLPRSQIVGHELAYAHIALEGTHSPFDTDYFEGANLGYKWFKAKNQMPLFPFGFGLSYTTFDYGALKAGGGAALNVTFDLRNTGKLEGMGTAQVYATPPGGVARLIGWSKLDLKPGEARRVSFTADPRLLATFDSAADLWRVADGNYTVSLGSSSADISASTSVHLDASTVKP